MDTKELVADLEEISNELDMVYDDESVKALPKTINKIKDKVDTLLQKLVMQ